MTLTSATPAPTPTRVAQGATPRDMVRRMLLAGLLASAPVALIAIVAWFLMGPRPGLSALLGAGGAILFSLVGHLVQWIWANAGPQAQLVAALASYVTRVGLFGVALALYVSLDNAATLHSPALVSSCVAVVLVWLIAEVIASSRLRILSFDDVDSGQNEEVTR